MTTKKTINALEFMDKLDGGPLTFGQMIWSTRVCDEISQEQFAKLLGISKSHLCDIEKERKNVSPERAFKFAKILGYSPELYVTLAVQGVLDKAGIDMKVSVA